MKLFDEDKLADEIVGSLIFNMKDIVGGKHGFYFWKNIYGSPLGVGGENTRLMNENPDLASTWKGRILMKVTAEKTEKPEIKKQSVEQEDIDGAFPFKEPHEYEIMVEFGMGIALPSSSKYTLKITLADYEIVSNAPFGENTFKRWNNRTEKLTWKTSYQDTLDIGRVYIYLMDGKNPVSYAQKDISLFTDPNAKYHWVELQPDLSIGKVKEHY